MPSKILIPNAASDSDVGITRIKDSFFARYYDDGVQRVRKIGDVTSKPTALRKARDAFYRELLAAGAQVAVRKDPKAKAELKPDRYVKRRAPWVVKIGGRIIAECETKGDAIAAQNEHLGISKP